MNATLDLPVICCGPRSAPLAEEDRAQLAARFKALADPTRVAILNSLSAADGPQWAAPFRGPGAPPGVAFVNSLPAGAEVCVCNLKGASGLPRPPISHPLKVLPGAAPVGSPRRGTWMYYRLVPESIAA